MVRAKVQWGETDAAGIVFYPNYFHWFDNAAHAFFRALGLPLADLMKQGIFTPILSAGSDFKAPLKYDDDITITSAITEVRNKSFRIEHTVRCGDVITGAGWEWRGWVIKESGQLRAVAIPDDVRCTMMGTQRS